MSKVLLLLELNIPKNAPAIYSTTSALKYVELRSGQSIMFFMTAQLSAAPCAIADVVCTKATKIDGHTCIVKLQPKPADLQAYSRSHTYVLNSINIMILFSQKYLTKDGYHIHKTHCASTKMYVACKKYV